MTAPHAQHDGGTAGDDAEIFVRQGFAQSVGFGQRPALLLVDFTNGFRDPAQFGGGTVEDAIAAAARLLAAARAGNLPVAHSRIVFADDGGDAGAWAVKVPPLRTLTESNPASHTVPELKAAPGELVLRKTVASAFFGTPLQAWLKERGVDTLVVAGVTTSGCVRASVVDAVSHGIRTIVARDACSDRHLPSHEMSLFDMQQKYADLADTADIIGKLRSLRMAGAAQHSQAARTGAPGA